MSSMHNKNRVVLINDLYLYGDYKNIRFTKALSISTLLACLRNYLNVTINMVCKGVFVVIYFRASGRIVD